MKFDCRKYGQDLSLLAAGALTKPEQAEIKRHLAACAGCRARYEELSHVTGPLARLRESVTDIEPSANAQEKWARAIRNAGASKQAENIEPATSFARLWRELILPYRRGWGTIAALWIAMWLVNWGQPEIHKAAGSGTSGASAVAINFEEERRLLAELIPQPDPAEPPRPKPSPHGERQRAWVMA